jgi:hypothetical protein
LTNLDIFPYRQIEKLISEFEQDEKAFNPARLVMENYPKVLIMYVASTFEQDIKDKLYKYRGAALTAGRLPDRITRIDENGRPDPLADKLFRKFEARVNAVGIETLSADEFYQLFTNEDFETNARLNFSSLHTRQVTEINSIVELYSSMPEDTNIVELHVKYDEIRRIWNTCTFEISRDAFLGLKLRRNNVAHDYIGGLSDTFSDIRDFYYRGLLFVMTLVDTLNSMTQICIDESALTET